MYPWFPVLEAGDEATPFDPGALLLAEATVARVEEEEDFPEVAALNAFFRFIKLPFFAGKTGRSGLSCWCCVRFICIPGEASPTL